jgi:hypothetical protein
LVFEQLYYSYFGIDDEGNMSSEILLSNIIPFAGSGLVGYAIGFL